MKVCSRCNLKLPCSAFSKRSKSKDGFQHACKDCMEIYRKNWGPEDRDRYNKKQQDKREQTKENYRRRQKRYNYIRNYRITPEEFSELVTRLKSKCECCGKVKRLVPDHDHETGKFRGALCYGCNISIGTLGDSEEGLIRALVYLRRSARKERNR